MMNLKWLVYNYEKKKRLTQTMFSQILNIVGKQTYFNKTTIKKI